MELPVIATFPYVATFQGCSTYTSTLQLSFLPGLHYGGIRIRPAPQTHAFWYSEARGDQFNLYGSYAHVLYWLTITCIECQGVYKAIPSIAVLL